jgi:hypothetical protein
MITIRLDGLANLQRRLSEAPDHVKERVLKKVAKTVLTMSKQQASKQTDLDGAHWIPHHAGRRRKMIVRLARRMKLVSINAQEAVIGWSSPVEGQIAAKQQFGATETVTATGNRGRSNQQRQDKSLPATRTQAKALLAAGYKRRIRAGLKTPSLKWIMGNMTTAQAGMIIKQIRGGDRSAWVTTLPARSFAGIPRDRFNELVNIAVAEAQAALRI